MNTERYIYLGEVSYEYMKCRETNSFTYDRITVWRDLYECRDCSVVIANKDTHDARWHSWY